MPRERCSASTSHSIFPHLVHCFFLVTVLVAYQISTRFYLGIVPVLWVSIGIAIQKASTVIASRYRGGALCLLGILCIGLNLSATHGYFHGLSRAVVSSADTERDLVFDSRHKVTLSQLRMIAQEADTRFPEPLPLFISGESRYARSLFVILSQEYGREGCYIKGSVEEGTVMIPHVHIEHARETNQDERESFTRVSFGTLVSYFSTGQEAQSPMPVDCLK